MKIEEGKNELDKLNHLKSMLNDCIKLQEEFIEYEENYNDKDDTIMKHLFGISNKMKMKISREKELIVRNRSGLYY